MQLKFDQQPFQLAAVDAMVAVFEGQSFVRSEAALLFSQEGIPAVPNTLTLSQDQLLANIVGLQVGTNLNADDELKLISANITTAEGDLPVAFPNFSVEMETGTGKTYVYIRTALELARRYGFRKFIVVVPSVAIREGVLKTFEITRLHFSQAFPELVYRYHTYSSDRLHRLSAFAESGDIEFMVITIDSFNKASNVMRQRPDAMNGHSPIHVIQAVRPVLILDEPQNMQSELSIQALAELFPLFAMRYSATHRDAYNLVHRLTPYDAYRLGLVKRISVASVLRENDDNKPFMRLVETRATGRTVTARLSLHVLAANGTVREKVCAIRAGDHLAEVTRRPMYDGYTVQRIDNGRGVITFSNGVDLSAGDSLGDDKDAIFEAQIVRALEEHFRKQEQLVQVGVKVLTLFFIDRVSNYADEGVIRRIFDRKFNEIKSHYPKWRAFEPAQVQTAYFASKRRKSGAVELLDSDASRPKAEDEAAFNLIMRDKERLLSFEEPVAFIFSHSALREGWDNPNIFQIVTLNQSASEIRKRQEIGRGLRLAVDQGGSRVHDSTINTLLVIANESYRDYVAQLQEQLDEEGQSIQDRAPAPTNANERHHVALRPEVLHSSEFQELWRRISRKTRYHVVVRTNHVIEQVVRRLDSTDLRAARIGITTAVVNVGDDNQLSASIVDASVQEIPGPKDLPNLIDLVMHQMQHTTPPMRLTRRTILEIIRQSSLSTVTAGLQNPQEFVLQLVRIIKDILADELVDGIVYVETGDAYRQELLEPPADGYAADVVPVQNSVLTAVPVDSQVERRFAQDLSARQDVPLFLKLPSRFQVQTPIGQYNPDWAIMLERSADNPDAEKPVLYLVRETKGSESIGTLRPNEARKIRCGEAHFQKALDVDFAVVTNADSLP